LDFGERIFRTQPLANLSLTEEERTHAGELVLFLTCPWRMEDKQRVLCSHYDVGTSRFQEVKTLVLDSTVRRSSVHEPGWDLEVEFSTGQVLRTFCDRAERESEANYTLFTTHNGLSVVAGNRIELEPREAFQ
jgi:hypothetical protein